MLNFFFILLPIAIVLTGGFGIAELVYFNTINDGCSTTGFVNWMIALGIVHLVTAVLFLFFGVLAIIRDQYNVENLLTQMSLAGLVLTSWLSAITSFALSVVGAVHLTHNWTFCTDPGHAAAVTSVTVGFCLPVYYIISFFIILGTM
jgi:hypothetical protein